MQPFDLNTYLPILIYLVIVIAFSLATLTAAHLIGPRSKPTPVKQMTYESGMDPVGDAHRRFDVRFYLVAILFIIFDLEVAFLFPWAVSLAEIGTFGFWSMVIFLGVLTVGFIYEWRKGALDWE